MLLLLAEMTGYDLAFICLKAPEGENQPSTAVDLFVSTEKIMVLNTDLQVNCIYLDLFVFMLWWSQSFLPKPNCYVLSTLCSSRHLDILV